MIIDFIKFLGLVFYYIRHELFKYSKDERAKFRRCPVCGHWTLNQNFICPYCHWEDDGYYDVNDYNKPSYPNGNMNVFEYREYIKNK